MQVSYLEGSSFRTNLVSFQDPGHSPYPHNGMDLAHYHVTSHAPIQIYTNNHMIAELAELVEVTCSVNLRFGGGSGERLCGLQRRTVQTW